MYIRLRYWSAVLSAILCLVSPHLRAQEFLTVDWKELRIDSVLPAFTHRIPLEKDFGQYDYSVRMEYPEFEKISAKEAGRIEEMGAVLPEWPEIQSYVEVSAKQGFLYVQLTPVVCRKNVYQRIKSLKLTVERTPKKTTLTRTGNNATEDTQVRYASSSVLSSGKWVKIRIQDTGIYKITHSALASMGFSDPSRVRLYGHGGRMMAETDIQNCIDDLKEVPLYRKDSYMLFYAHGTVKWSRNNDGFTHSQNTYSTHGYYFLTEDANISPMSFPKAEVVSGGGEVTTFPDYALYENDNFSWYERGRLFFENYNYKNGRTKNYTLNLPDIVPQRKSTVRVSFGADDTSASKVTVSANGQSCGTLSISPVGTYIAFQHADKAFTTTGKLSATTTFTLTQSANSSASGYFDYIEANYIRTLRLNGSYTCFRSNESGLQTFSIAGTDANTTVWKISDGGASGYSYAILPGSQTGNSIYKVGDNVSLTDEYVVLNTASSAFPEVEVVGDIANQNLHAMGTVDMLIVIPASAKWAKQAERLAELHRIHDGLRVAVVRADQIYNEFSSGTPDATAIRRFMKMFYDRAESEADLPKHLLLFADCAADNRMISPSWKNHSPEDFLLCFQSEKSYSATTSYIMEEYFCLLDDSETSQWTKAKSDAAVGRLTVRSSAQATVVVDKIESYLTRASSGSWRNKICMLADDGVSEGDYNEHPEHADEIAEDIRSYNPGYSIEKIYWDAYVREQAATGARFPEVEKRLKEIAKEGALMINYSGHGRAESLSHEYCWTLTEMNSSTSTRFPLWVTAACDTSPIDLPEDNMGEAALLNAKGGGIAMLGTTRSTYGSQSLKLNKAFCKYLFRDGHTLGEALRLAKNEASLASYVENNLHYVLVGDPALRLAAPYTFDVEVTEINGTPTNRQDGSVPQLKAGSLATIKGRIVDEDGNTANDFNGMVYPTIYDRKEEVTCLGNNEDLVTTKFQYEDYTKKLYAGSDSVRHGEFSFTIPVPLEISYSDENGAMCIYAENENRQAGNGGFTDFLIGGTEDGYADDHTGPEITAYLNTTDFVAGDRTNETPLLLLSLYDNNGINATGSGVGHDLIAIIDNDPQMTYVLNNYYSPEPGGYTRGNVTFSLPEMEAGPHTLMVRAWDVLNNSNTIEMPFEVVKGLAPSLINMWCTECPARTSTTFIVTHNRPQSALTVKFEVFDFTGRLLWEYTENGTPSGNDYRVTWNLTTTSGQPISNGVYLYRATVSSPGGSESTKARKIVISRQ